MDPLRSGGRRRFARLSDEVTRLVPTRVDATLTSMTLIVELEREEDGRWLAESGIVRRHVLRPGPR